MILVAVEDGQRLDAAIAGLSEELSRSAAQRLIDDGLVTVNGQPVRKNYKTAAGDEIRVELPPVQEVDLLPEDIPLDVVYEDEDVIVINKPKGLVVHPAAGHATGTLVNALMHHCGDSLSGIGGEKRPGIVHRIDKDTSGLLIAAKNDAAHQALSDQLKDHSLARTYECIALGAFREDSGVIDAPIGRHPTDRKKMTVTAKGGKEAVTHWKVLGRYPGYTHLQCDLETGRTHQIRVHLAWRSHPIAGDAVYGRTDAKLNLTSQCLHAVRLRFRHPRTGEAMECTAPLPPEFEAALQKLRRMT